MITLKKITLLSILIISVSSFSKIENPNIETTLNLAEFDVIETLSENNLGCRPSTEIVFYVETNLIKKHRGSSTINASIFVLDKNSGKTAILANETIIIPNHKETFLHYNTIKSDCEKTTLLNGDKIMGNTLKAPYCFSELIKYETIYNSYVSATNNLLAINRTI